MTKKLSKKQKEINKIARNCIKYILSEEGKAELKRVMEEAHKRTEEMRKSQEVTWEMMNTPVTI